MIDALITPILGFLPLGTTAGDIVFAAAITAISLCFTAIGIGFSERDQLKHATGMLLIALALPVIGIAVLTH